MDKVLDSQNLIEIKKMTNHWGILVREKNKKRFKDDNFLMIDLMTRSLKHILEKEMSSEILQAIIPLTSVEPRYDSFFEYFSCSENFENMVWILENENIDLFINYLEEVFKDSKLFSNYATNDFIFNFEKSLLRVSVEKQVEYNTVLNKKPNIFHKLSSFPIFMESKIEKERLQELLGNKSFFTKKRKKL